MALPKPTILTIHGESVRVHCTGKGVRIELIEHVSPFLLDTENAMRLAQQIAEAVRLNLVDKETGT